MAGHNGNRLSLREARDRTGLGREKVAAQIGISSKTLERWEKAGTRKRYKVAELAAIYGVSIYDIAYEQKKPKRGRRK